VEHQSSPIPVATSSNNINPPTNLASFTHEQRAMWQLYSIIKEHRDQRGRLLHLAFARLPSKMVGGHTHTHTHTNMQDYPDYYEVIRKPMDMARIHARLTSTCSNVNTKDNYDNFDAVVNDFWVMFDNACRYNEPESVIYKVRVCLIHLHKFA
jgi:hypothetical protein